MCLTSLTFIRLVVVCLRVLPVLHVAAVEAFRGVAAIMTLYCIVLGDGNQTW